MRYFAAIPFPENLKSKVNEIIRGRLPVPYVNTTNLHITLIFFGELDTDESRRLKDEFKSLVPKAKPFNIELDKVVQHHNRQLHMTLKPNKVLSAIQHEMQNGFADAKFDIRTDRDYYPHMKLANMHMDNVMNRERKVEHFPNEELQQLNFEADSIVLYQSELLLHHAKHTPLIEVKL